MAALPMLQIGSHKAQNWQPVKSAQTTIIEYLSLNPDMGLRAQDGSMDTF